MLWTALHIDTHAHTHTLLSSGRLGQPNQSSSSSSFGKGGSVAGGGSGPRRNGGGSAGGSTNRANSTVVKVDGFTGAINETDFISFVRRHVPRVHLSKFSIEAGSVLLTLRTIGEAQAVAKLRRLTYNQDTVSHTDFFFKFIY